MNNIEEIFPKVSIVLPTYNRSYSILKSINSVLSQSYEDFELIVVDDASVDDTEAVMSSIADHRVKYIRHEYNKGGAIARNTGIAISRGEFIAFQDSDDEWLQDKLDTQMREFEFDPNLTAVYTGYYLVKNQEAVYMPTEKLQSGSGKIFTKLLRDNCISTQTLVVKSGVLKSIGGFDEFLPRLQDWELVLRLSKVGEFKFIDQPFVNVNYTNDSITATSSKFFTAMEYIIKKHSNAFDSYPNIKANHLYTLGVKYLESGLKKNAAKYLIKSFNCEKQPRCIIAIFSCLFGYKFYKYLRDKLKR